MSAAGIRKPGPADTRRAAREGEGFSSQDGEWRGPHSPADVSWDRRTNDPDPMSQDGRRLCPVYRVVGIWPRFEGKTMSMLDWLHRPLHHRAVHVFRRAAECGDGERLAALLDPGVAVVVDAGDQDQPRVRVVYGVYEAIALLMHGMAAKPGLIIDERSVNAQAGLLLRRGGETIAAMTVDFTRGLISMVWIRLRPEKLRHWNEV